MHFIVSLLVLQLAIRSLDGKCLPCGPKFYEDYCAECYSIDEEQLLTIVKNSSSNLKQLTIENSFIPNIEIFPIKFARVLESLSITNSRIREIATVKEGFAGYTDLKQLNLSFNEIRDMSFYRSINTLTVTVMHHNQIEFLNGSDLAGNFWLKTIDFSHNNIKNFTKLQNTQLLSLNLSHNSIEKIADLLDNLIEIQIVDLSHNKLKNIFAHDFRNSPKIESLYLHHNNIISFQYDGRTRIFQQICGTDEIDLSFNNIKLSNDIYEGNMKSINLEKNGLKDLNFLVSNISKEIYANCFIFRNNKLRTLYPYTFKGYSLNKLDLSVNEIELILPSTFEGLLRLNELYLDHNKISYLNSSSFSGLSHLERLNLSFNPLTTIHISVFEELKPRSLDLSHCLLRKIHAGLFEHNPSFEIYLHHNNIYTIEPKSFSSLNILDLSYNEIRSLPANVFSGLVIQKSLNLSYNHLESLKDVFNNTKISNVIMTGFSLSKLSEDDVKDLGTLRYLDLGNTGIEELSNNTFDQLLSLETLKLDDNSIRILPSNFFGFNEQLTSLSIVRNPLSIIPVDSFPHKMKLKYLHLTINGKILKKRFFNLIFLEELNIVDSLVTEIHKYSFKGLVSLVKLSFQNSTVLKVEPGAFAGLRNVIDLDAQNLFANITALRSKTFVGLESLGVLNLSKIGIGSIEDGAFFGLASLAQLNLSHNKIGNLPKNAFIGLRNLATLDLSKNNLTGKESTFPIGTFRDLVSLTELHLQHNRIIKFQIGEFSNLRNLKFLNLSHNQLSYLDRHLLFPLRNLQVLDINSNHVIKFDYHFTFKHLSHLKTIGIGENKWPCENMTIMLNNFEENGVNYREISKLEFEAENIGGIYCVHVCNYLYCPTEEDLVVTY